MVLLFLWVRNAMCVLTIIGVRCVLNRASAPAMVFATTSLVTALASRHQLLVSTPVLPAQNVSKDTLVTTANEEISPSLLSLAV